jgi:hypothetical protein
MTWKRGAFKIALNPRCAFNKPGDTGKRIGWIGNGVFTIHNEKGRGDHPFVLSHGSSGFKFREYSHLKLAKAAAERIATLPISVDWNLPRPFKGQPYMVIECIRKACTG